MILRNKVAIVTGGASGIGKATVRALSNEGANVIIADVNLTEGRKVANEIRGKTKNIITAVKTDVSNIEDITNMTKVTLSNFGKIDILVNSAGICQIKPINELSEQDWDSMYSINLKGVFLCCQIIIEIMKRQSLGKIINIASLAGEVGGVIVGANYAATKGGVICLTKSFAKYGAPYNINVNAISPGFINTPMTKNFNYNPESVPLKRIGTPEEIADVVLFLASDYSRYITGANIDVNGGIYMG